MKQLYKRVKHQKEFILTNDEIDKFFSKDFLLNFLKLPLWLHTEELISLYHVYFKKLYKDCIYREARVTRHKKDLAINIFFDTGEHKFMLLVFYQHQQNIFEQSNELVSVLTCADGFRESSICLDQETLPVYVERITKDLTTIQHNQVKLLKIDCPTEDYFLSFHTLNMLFDLKKPFGLSVLAGFQY